MFHVKEIIARWDLRSQSHFPRTPIFYAICRVISWSGVTKYLASPPYVSSVRVLKKIKMAEYFDEVVLDAEDLEKLFEAATEFVRTIKNLSDEKKLTFYALYKQVCIISTRNFR